jgi:hypothetical protein
LEGSYCVLIWDTPPAIARRDREKPWKTRDNMCLVWYSKRTRPEYERCIPAWASLIGHLITDVFLWKLTRQVTKRRACSLLYAVGVNATTWLIMVLFPTVKTSCFVMNGHKTLKIMQEDEVTDIIQCSEEVLFCNDDCCSCVLSHARVALRIVQHGSRGRIDAAGAARYPIRAAWQHMMTNDEQNDAVVLKALPDLWPISVFAVRPSLVQN